MPRTRASGWAWNSRQKSRLGATTRDRHKVHVDRYENAFGGHINRFLKDSWVTVVGVRNANLMAADGDLDFRVVAIESFAVDEDIPPV